MRLILVRHGETTWNRARRNQGRTQTPLNSRGVRQAENIARALQSMDIRAIHSSPLVRAMETAEIIGEALSLPVIPQPGLVEMDLGQVDGLTNAEMGQQFAEVVHQWREDPSAVRMPGGESLRDVQERAWQTLEEIRESANEEHAVTVTHNFVIGVLVLRALGLPLSHFQRLRIELGSMTTLEHSHGEWRLISLNETLHHREA